MQATSRLIREIETLPPSYIQEIEVFVRRIKLKQNGLVPDTMALSEKALSKDWDTPEEDEAWKDL